MTYHKFLYWLGASIYLDMSLETTNQIKLPIKTKRVCDISQNYNVQVQGYQLTFPFDAAQLTGIICRMHSPGHVILISDMVRSS
jgi:hypothetical protein